MPVFAMPLRAHDRGPATGPRRARRLLALLASACLVPALAAGATPAAAATAPVTGSPLGHLDSVVAVDGGVRIRGWAWDPDTTAAVSLRVTAGPVSTTGSTGVYRSDVARVYPAAGSYRGFLLTVATPPGVQRVCVTAVDVGNGSDRTFWCATVTVADHVPVGALEMVEATPTGLRVGGWAQDQDTTAPVGVRLTVDGVAVSTVPAGSARTAAPTGPFGFTTEVPASIGSHEVCATAVNADAGASTPLGCRTATVLDHRPTGALTTIDDTPTGVAVTGWATDVDTAAVTVRLTIDGTRTVTTVAGASGFAAEVPAGIGGHEVCATAVNTGPGTDTALGCGTATVIDHAPQGALESTTATVEGIEVTGWATDVDADQPVTVRLTVDGATLTVPADQARTAAPTGTTGFDTLVDLAPGTHEVCATAVNAGAGADKTLGCGTATVPTPAPMRPGPTTTGVPAGTVLTVHSGDLTISTPGAVVSNLDVRGFVRVTAPGVTIRNSILRGGVATGSSKGIVSVTSSTASLTIEDTEIVAGNPSGYIDGLRGWNITARRLNIHGVIDAMHIYGPNVTLEDSWLHDNLHYASDPNQSGGASHDDSIQIQTGSNIVIRGNVISGAYNTGIQFTQDLGLVSNVTVEGNWLDGGGCTINVAEKGRGPIQGIVVRDNTFGRTTRLANCAMISPVATSLSTSNNWYVDGVVAAVRRG